MRLPRPCVPLFALALIASTDLGAQAPPAQLLPERAIRRDLPMPNGIRRAHAAGTRDSTGRPGRAYWQLRTDYTINVRLDPSTQRLTGRESIVIHNTSPDSLSEIVLRLDPNVFIGTNPGAAPWVPAELTDGMIITRMAVDGRAVDLAPRQTAGNQRSTELIAVGLRSTSARVLLPTPIPPRSRTTLEVEWNHKLPGGPGVGHRMTQRWADTLFQPTQWYPRVAKYDDLRGWDTELYLGPSEFYNNFGRFDVRIDVPAGWLVSGTGVLQNPEQVLTPAARQRLALVTRSDSIITIVGPDEIGPGQATARPASGDRLVWHFVADTVNDFAWATANKYVWQSLRATIPLGASRGGVQPWRRVSIHMFFLPGRENLFRDTQRAERDAGLITRHALEFYSRLWFPYEFPQLTLQDGPSAGMEYPMVINSNRGAADHEAAHQWWPMVVGTNETWYGWLDEGLNQYMNILSAADVAGERANLDRLGESYGRRSGDEAEAPMMWNANYAGPSSYGFTTYSKMPLVLSSLGGIVGDTAVQRGIREWAVAWKYRHPSPWDFMFSMNRSLGRDLGWFWYYWLFTTESVDGSIQSVRSAGPRTTVTIRQDGQMPSPVILRVHFASSGPTIRPMANATMQDATTAIVTWPVDVWFGGSRTFDAVLDFGGRPIERIVLDPHCRFPDRDQSDNVWPRQAQGAGQGC